MRGGGRGEKEVAERRRRVLILLESGMQHDGRRCMIVCGGLRKREAQGEDLLGLKKDKKEPWQAYFACDQYVQGSMY